ncbi:MAG: hypothetical protein HY918_04075 [Candidatus Doudnabacteria bacterium]|nr:hypothetical protein [Candidatus Doudnabacteria bacterium]
MSSIQDVLNQLEFTAKLYRKALEGTHPYKPAIELYQAFLEIKARAENQLMLAAERGESVLMQRLLLIRIADEVGGLERAAQIRQSP